MLIISAVTSVANVKSESSLQIGALIFDGFELLDMFGPLEMYGMYPEKFEITMVGVIDRPIKSAQGPQSLPDSTIFDGRQYDLIVVPGGRGTRNEIKNSELLDWLRKQSKDAQYVTSVCTGSALLARSGVLNGYRATTNKRAFEWVATYGDNVSWVKQARWVADGKFYTSSGVSAGTDMTLALIEEILGHDAATQAANWAEYNWQQDPDIDPFAELAGLLD